MSVDFPPLQSTVAIVDPRTGYPSQAFMVWWQQFRNQLQAALNTITDQQQDIIEALTAAGIALEAAIDAGETAEVTARELARINSYTIPTDVLTASDAGSDASIAIASHTRVYPVQGGIDVPDLAVTAGSVTGLAFSTTYYVYYDDPALEDVTPTFAATTNQATAQVGAATGRHFVGKVTTPADGGGGTSGGGGYPPGGGGGNPIP